MLETILTLTLQEAKIEKETGATKTQTPTKIEKYAGGYYLFIVKGDEKWSFELPKDKTIDMEAFKKEISSVKGVKEVQFDEKTKTWTIKVDKEDEVVKIVNKHGFIKQEKKTETK
jgi:hypothetical protein